MAERPKHLSPSAWNKWSQCQRLWAATYVDHLSEPPSAAMEVGSFVHHVFEELMLYQPERRTVDTARLLATNCWLAYRTDKATSIARGEVTEREFKAAAWRAVLGLFEVEDPTEVDVVAVERTIEWTEQGVPFKVIVDRVERPTLGPGLAVVDYKAGRLPDEKYQGGHKRQVVIGAMGVAATIKGGPAQVGSLLYVSADTTVAVDTTLRARQTVAEAAQVVWEAIGRACATGDTWSDYEPKAGVLCHFCALAAECPEGRAHIRRAESGGWRSYHPEGIGAKAVAARDR